MSADATNVVDVFDSNVWVLALTESSTKAEILLEEILEDERTVAVSPYVFVEVLGAFARELNSREQVDGYQTAFATIVADSSSIEGPAQDDIERADLDAVRDSGEATFIPRILSIQAKDVLIVLSAWSYYDRFWEYARTHLIEPRYGTWYEKVTREGERIAPANDGPRVEPGYHPVTNARLAMAALRGERPRLV